MSDMNLRHFAYIGDAVWELFVREHTILKTQNSKDLHKITTDKVKASYQAEILEVLEEELTAEENEIARRGRNLTVPSARKSTQAEYRQATAFETLIGWWYLNNNKRLQYILKKLEPFL